MKPHASPQQNHLTCMKHDGKLPRGSALILGALLCAGIASGQPDDFSPRYAPASWFSAICFPDDWQKSVLTSRGTLGDDFAPGPYASPLSEISFGVSGHTLHADTVLFESPRIPIGDIVLRDQTLSVRQRIFAIPPATHGDPSRLFLNGRLERLGGLTGCPAWSSLPDNIDPAFRGVAWGVNRPIHYRVKVEPGSSRMVVLGLCEPYKQKPGTRLLVLGVEGAGDAIVDPVRAGKPGTPMTEQFAARDLDNNGWLDMTVRAAMESPDPNVILNALWVFPSNSTVDADSLLHGRLSQAAELYWPCGNEFVEQRNVCRQDALLAVFPADSLVPTLTIHTRRRIAFDTATGMVTFRGHPYVMCTPTPSGAAQSPEGLVLEFPKGTTEAAAIVTHGIPATTQDVTMPLVIAARDSARAFWLGKSGIPYGSIILPDSALQALLEASIRNLYAVAERVDGRPQFQPGPSVYRGLWIHDAVWHNTAALWLNDSDRVRTSIESMLRHQHHDGQVEVMAPYPMNRETPTLLYLMCAYARMTNSRTWLEQHWSAVQRGNRWLWALRQSTLNSPDIRSRGLFPPGFSDGGVGGVQSEYASVYWGLAGLAATAEAARWLGYNDEARVLEKQFNELRASFEVSAARDIRHDAFGNAYLPMQIGDSSASTPPQRAAWGPLDAQALEHIFDDVAPLLKSTLRMLRAETREGLPPNTGWLTNGVWPFFGSIEALAHLAAGEPDDANKLLYAVAQHASPTWTWVEEQLPHDLGVRTTGDGSNASASALFIMLIRNMVFLEHDTSMEMLTGIPPELYRPGAHTEVNDAPTMFGKCSFHLDVASDSSRVTIIVNPFSTGTASGTVAIDLHNIKRAGYAMRQRKPAPDLLRFNATKGVRLVLTRS
jgi:hypothetical protein